MSSLSRHLSQWESAMRCGLIGGRPFSEGCIKNYVFYVAGFLKQYGELNLENVKALMLSVPLLYPLIS